jgi:uncharacterized delta-60 repeat protein
MKKTITFLLTILSFGHAQSQAPTIQWQKCFGGTGLDYAKSIQTTPDGGYIVAGYSDSTNGNVSGNHGGGDCWVVKLDTAGAMQWQKALGGSGYDFANSIQNTSDGGYIVAGYSRSSDGDLTINHGQGGRDYWVVKLNTTGTIQWQKSLGGTGDDSATNIQQTIDGGYIIAGSSTSNDGDVTGNHGNSDYWVVKINATGSIQWQKSLGGSVDETANAIQTTSDGGYIVAGSTNSSDGNITGYHGYTDYWVVKLDATGTIQWQKILGGTNLDQAQSIQTTSDGGYVVAGFSRSTDGDVTGNHGPPDYWVVKLDSTGTIQWQKTLGGTSSDYANSIQTTTDGGYIVAGYSFSTNGDVIGNHGFADSWLVKLDATGTIQWQKSMGGTDDDGAYAIQPTSDGGYIIAGDSLSNNGDVTGNHGGEDFWIVKLGPDLATPSFDKNAVVIYPNPVCNELQIQTPNNTTITKATILAINGQVVLEQSQNTNTINVEKLAQGVYILEAYSGQEKQVSKFVKE